MKQHLNKQKGQGSGTHVETWSIVCPECQGESKFEMWDCIDAVENPELRERVIHDPTLFYYYCSHCYTKLPIGAPCLYLDRKRKVMVWLIPDAEMVISEDDLKRFFGPGSYADYRCRIVRSWGEWREKIIEMESVYDDRLYELIKCGALRLLKDEVRNSFYLPAYHVEYADDHENKDELALVFMKNDAERSGYVYPLSPKIMDLTKDIFESILEHLPNTPAKGKFIDYGYHWAELVVNYVLEAAAKGKDDVFKQLISLWFYSMGKEIFQSEIDTGESSGTTQPS